MFPEHTSDHMERDRVRKKEREIEGETYRLTDIATEIEPETDR